MPIFELDTLTQIVRKALSERKPKKAGKEGKARKEQMKALRNVARCGQGACKEKEQVLPSSADSSDRVDSHNL